MHGRSTYWYICFAWLILTHNVWGQVTAEHDPPPLFSQRSLQRVPDSLLNHTVEPLSLPARTLVEAGDSSLLPGEIRKAPQRLTIFGYFRLLGYGRNMVEPYPNLAPYEKAYGIGDGYREPMLSMTVTARPNGKTTFGTELYIFNPYAGGGTADNVFTMNLGINLYGNFRTKVGRFGVRAGGIHWYALSPFTMGTYQVLDRYSIYERTPWEGVTHTDKYDSYYETGAINRGDVRWANRAFQGIIAEGAGLPGDLSFAVLYGKTQPNAGLTGNQTDPFATIFNPRVYGNVPTYTGFAGANRAKPSLAAGGRIEKRWKGGNRISYNTLNSWTYLDSLSDDKRAYQVHTLAFYLNFAGLQVTGEMGAGNFSTPDVSAAWGEALMVNVGIPKKYTFLPLSVQLYQIGANFYNENGEILTFSNPQSQNFVIGQATGQASAGGALTLVGQLAHNRRGINLNTEARLGALSVNLGWGVAKELEALSSTISYDHRINGLAMTRIYNPFPANATRPTIVGPYNRVTTYFRGAFEQVQTTDLDPATAAARYLKVFNAVDIQGKYKTEIFDHDLFLFYLGSFQSARRDLGVLPVFQEDTYVFAQYHELDLYLELFPDFIFAGYAGLELIQGGIHTEINAESLAPRDQIGTALGAGFDWTIASNAGLYLRHRWMNFEDRNFALDHYKGRETTIELKIYF
jgi:hypothetical protein